MHTLVGDRWRRESRVLSEFSETVLRPRSGNGVIPQVIKQTHESDVGEYGILDRYLTKEKVEQCHGFQNYIWTVNFNPCGRGIWTLPEIRFGVHVGPKNLGISMGWSRDTCTREWTIT
jgi:hypothetical protein